MLFRVRLKAWAVDDGEVCNKTVKFRALGGEGGDE